MRKGEVKDALSLRARREPTTLALLTRGPVGLRGGSPGIVCARSRQTASQAAFTRERRGGKDLTYPCFSEGRTSNAGGTRDTITADPEGETHNDGTSASL